MDYPSSGLDPLTGFPKKERTVGVDVALALLLSDNKVWIQQRKTSDHLRGCWEFPGGKLKTNEGTQTALEREILEELNLDLSRFNLKQFRRIVYTYPERTVNLHFFACPLPSQVRLRNGRWVKPSDLSIYHFPPANTSIVEDIQKQSNLILFFDKLRDDLFHECSSTRIIET